MEINPLLATRLQAIREANQEKSAAYLAQAKHILAQNAPVAIGDEDLANWGREKITDNPSLSQLSQTVTRFGENTPEENVGVVNLAQTQPKTVFQGQLNNNLIDSQYFPTPLESRRLSPGDNIAVYRPDYTDRNTGIVTPSAVRYANVTGYGADPTNKGLPIEFLPGKSTAFDSLSPEQQAFALNKVSPEDSRSNPADGLNQFYKPSAIGWDNSPVPNQTGRLPFVKSNVSNPSYSDATMAGIDRVLIGNEYKDVAWTNHGKNNGGVQPYIFDANQKPLIHLSNAIPPEQYQEFMSGANVPKFMNEGMMNRFRKDNPDLSNYNIRYSDASADFKRVQGTQISDGELTLPTQGEMWGIGQELNDINKAQEQALRSRASESINIYRGSNEEPGLQAIDAVAQAGGSGSWVDDNQEQYLNLFSANKQSQGASMTAADLARGGTWQSGRSQPSAALPDLTQEDFISDRTTYSPKGYPIDAPVNIIRMQGAEGLETGQHPGYYNASRYIPKGVTALTPASEFYDLAAQWKFNPERNTQRFPTNPETPLSLAEVNEYSTPLYPSNPDNAYNYPINEAGKNTYQGRIIPPLSVQRNNGTLDDSQLSSRGRWMGGGLQGKGRSRDDSIYNPLNSSNQINLPPNSRYARLLSDTDPRTQEALANELVVRKAAADYQEPETVAPFTRQYQISQTGNQIPGVVPSGQIPGVFLPVMHEENIPGGTKIEPAFMPYSPSIAPPELLDQHLADARIELDGSKYPLTPEATTVAYLPKPEQLSAENIQRHSKTRVGVRDQIDWWNQDGPTDADLNAIANDGELNFNPGEDIKAARVAHIGLSNDYADSSIAPTDIVSAIDSKKQELNRVNAVLNNYQTSPTINQPVLSDTNTGQTVKVIDKDGNITIRPANSFDKQRQVTSEDGTKYTEDVDSQPVNQKDLQDIFDVPTPMNAQELAARSQFLQGEIARATNAHNQLIGLESQPEIEIRANVGKSKRQVLADEMEASGLYVKRHSILGSEQGEVMVNKDGQIYASGSLPVGLPSDRPINLPVHYNKTEILDPETVAMANQGKADTVAAQKLINLTTNVLPSQRQALRLIENLKPLAISDNIAAPVVVEPTQEPQYLNINDLISPSPTKRTYTPQTISDDSLVQQPGIIRVNANKFERLPQPLAPTPTGFAEPQYLSVDRNGQLATTGQAIIPDEVIPSRQRRTNQQQSIYNQTINVPYKQVYDSSPSNSREIPNWVLPVAGGAYLAAAGVNEYQREQEQKQKQDEAQLRRLYQG